jgi:hypothetical protein
MNGAFAVSQSGRAAEELAAILELLRQRGETAIAARSVHWILEELSRTPLEFGESRYHLEHFDLYIRVGFAGPCRVNFAVSVPHRQVFIRGWNTPKSL